MNILVCDDSQVIRSFLEDILVTGGYSVSTVSNGIECLDILKKKKFDLLFLDIDMPNLSGLQVCRMLRNDTSFRSLPIIMLTARDTRKDKSWGLQTGANSYITKPFDPDTLLRTLTETMERVAVDNPVDDGRETLDIKVDNEEDIIFKAGELQEAQLFRVTTINRILNIANTPEGSARDLSTVCRLMSEIFASIIDFDLATFMIAEEDRMRMFVSVNRPITRDFFIRTKRVMMQEYRTRLKDPNYEFDSVDVDLQDPEHNMLKDNGADKPHGIFNHVLESNGELFGMITLSRGKKGHFKQDEIDTFSIVANPASLVIDNVRMFETIKRFAVADGLTGVYNHRYFQEQLEKEYSRTKRFNLSLSVILLDIDNFKLVNDNYGHQQGDAVLKGVASILKKSVRDIDLVARYGGEEFAAVLPETPKKSALVVAERMRNSIATHKFKCKQIGNLEVRASFGVAGYPDDDIVTRLDMIAKADEALYRAKKKGKNMVCLYSPEGNDS